MSKHFRREAAVNGMRPSHPGEVLRGEFLVPLGLSARALSIALKGAGQPVSAPDCHPHGVSRVQTQSAMPRLACPQAPGVVLHLVQRGRDSAACFRLAREASAYLRALDACARDCECAVHAYALMRNHVHLLLTPAREGAATELVRAVVASHVRYLDEERSCRQAPWDEAFDASPVYVPRYLLSCMRYIEENPVRAGLVQNPASWRWSSFAANALGREDPVISPHAVYCSLGRTPEERRRRYRSMFLPAPDARVLP